MRPALLGPTDREGGDDERAAPVVGGPDDALELLGDRRGIVATVPVRRLDEHIVRLAQGLRIEEHRRRIPSDVAREHEAPRLAVPLHVERDGGRAQDVPGPPEGRPKARQKAHRLPVLEPVHALGGPRALLRRVERQRRRVLRGPPRVVVGGLLLLEVAGVRQHDPRQVGRAPRRRDLPLEAVLDQPGQIAGVVDVGVREGDGVDPRGVDGQSLPVPEA
jgi:hypothetical protein